MMLMLTCSDLYSYETTCWDNVPAAIFSQKRVLHLINATDENVRQYMARLINAFASLTEGECWSRRRRCPLSPLPLRIITSSEHRHNTGGNKQAVAACCTNNNSILTSNKLAYPIIKMQRGDWADVHVSKQPVNILFDIDSHTDSVALAHFFRTGRVYLSKSSALLKLLTACLKEEEKDSPSRQNVLVAVQKLSLRYIFKWDWLYFLSCGSSVLDGATCRPYWCPGDS